MRKPQAVLGVRCRRIDFAVKPQRSNCIVAVPRIV
jgi:hypothetical protein